MRLRKGALMHTKRHSAVWLTLFVLAVFGAIVPLQAQTVTGTITGEVTDPSNAPVPGAKITATDTERGTQYTTTSNPGGRYTLSSVPVGTYDVKVENAGFQTATQSNMVLQLNQVAKLDV